MQKGYLCEHAQASTLSPTPCLQPEALQVHEGIFSKKANSFTKLQAHTNQRYIHLLNPSPSQAA